MRDARVLPALRRIANGTLDRTDVRSVRTDTARASQDARRFASSFYVDRERVAIIRHAASARLLVVHSEVVFVIRAFVLVLLGGSLLWFVLQSIGDTRAGEAESPTAAAGSLLPPDSSAPPTKPAEQAPEHEAVEPNSERPATAVEPAAPSIAPSAVASASSTEPARPMAPPTAAGGSEAEIALAGELLHRPRGVADFARASSDAVGDGRKSLALAYAAAIQGDSAEAQRIELTLKDNAAVSESERQLLSRALEHSADQPVFAAVTHETPLAQAATMGLLAKEGQAALQKGDARDAARVFSDLLLEEIRAPWKPDTATLKAWSEALRRAQAGYQWNRSGDWPSVQVTVEKGDSLISIRKRVLKEHPELVICTGLIERANELRGGVVHPGQVLRIPTERARILVSIGAHWAFFMLGEHAAAAWEVGVGKAGSETRPGSYVVGEKSTEPMWFRPGGKPVPFGDPENPLGTRWIAWRLPDGSSSGFGFHGTKDPESIGQDQSQGCVRMLNRDVEELFEVLPKDAAILVQP
jgi:hypothetical protein